MLLIINYVRSRKYVNMISENKIETFACCSILLLKNQPVWFTLFMHVTKTEINPLHVPVQKYKKNGEKIDFDTSGNILWASQTSV